MVEWGIWYKSESKNYYSLGEAIIYFPAPGDHGSEEGLAMSYTSMSLQHLT